MTLRSTLGFFSALCLASLSGTAQDKTALAGSENPVDRILQAKWKELKIKPNARSNDAEFLRRASLDLVGTIPEPDEVGEFVSRKDSRKREKKIDELIASERFAEYWAERLTSVLAGYRDNQYPTLAPLKQWLTEKLKSGVPYNDIVTQLITAAGSNKNESSTAFVLQHLAKDRSKRVLTVQVAKVFLGIQLQCAQCHNHPFEPWTQADFNSMVSFFGETNIRVIERMENIRNSEVEVVDVPARGRRAIGKPKFIDGTTVDARGARESLARMITSSENLQFARATVNRFWAEMTGRGFVEPIDDFSSKNVPAHPDLLDALARGFVESNFSLQWLIRTIAGSEAYQLSSKRKPRQWEDEDAAKANYAFQIVRPMSPEQSLRVLITAQGLDRIQAPAAGRGPDADLREKLRQGFLRSMVLTSAAENQVSPSEYSASMQQVMNLLNVNAPFYRGLQARGLGRLAQILRQVRKPEEVIGQLYLSTVSRPPSQEELAACLKAYAEYGKNDQAFEKIFFVLLNTNEFFFNH